MPQFLLEFKMFVSSKNVCKNCDNFYKIHFGVIQIISTVVLECIVANGRRAGQVENDVVVLISVARHASLAERLPARHRMRDVHWDSIPLVHGHDIPPGQRVSSPPHNLSLTTLNTTHFYTNTQELIEPLVDNTYN